MTIYVRGFALPPLLEKLMKEGVWIPNYHKGLVIPEKLLSAIDIQESIIVAVLSEKEIMESNTDSTWFGNESDKDFDEYRAIFSYESSKRSGTQITNTTKLDVDKAISIAWNQDEDHICLDYRHNPPKIVILDWENREWKVLAPDFGTFVKEAGLIK